MVIILIDFNGNGIQYPFHNILNLLLRSNLHTINFTLLKSIL